MAGIYKELINELDELFYVKRKIEDFLKTAPEGYLHTENRKGHTYYYWDKRNITPFKNDTLSSNATQSEKSKPDNNKTQSKKSKQKNSPSHSDNQKRIREKAVYIKRDDVAFAKLLGTKAYYKNLIKDVNEEIKLLEKYINLLSENKKEKDYEYLTGARKQLVNPFYEFPESKVNKWKKEEFQSKQIGEGVLTYETHNGEQVRSKSEKIIADELAHRGIPYKYECPIQLDGVPYPIYPDFTVINKRTANVFYWEHLGKMDSLDYYDGAMNRLALYSHNGIFIGKNLIISYETSKNPLSIELIDHYIKEFLI